MIAQVVFGVYLMATFATLSVRYWYGEGGGRAPRSALYGIWNVEELAVDGEARPGGAQRLRPPMAAGDLRRAAGRGRFSASTIRWRTTARRSTRAGRTLVADEGREPDLAGELRGAAAGPNRLVLDGEMDGHHIRMRLALVELDTFRLLNSTFRWVRPPDPFAG